MLPSQRFSSMSQEISPLSGLSFFSTWSLLLFNAAVHLHLIVSSLYVSGIQMLTLSWISMILQECLQSTVLSNLFSDPKSFGITTASYCQVSFTHWQVLRQEASTGLKLFSPSVIVIRSMGNPYGLALVNRHAALSLLLQQTSFLQNSKRHGAVSMLTQASKLQRYTASFP